MKITGIDTFDLRIPMVKPVALEFAEHRVVAAVLHTDEGVDGLGYTLAFGGGGAESIRVYLETRLKPLVVGEDPLFVERLWERMFRADRGIKRQGVAAYALSAIDIGLWDIVGKAAGLPLYKLWGAVTDRVPAYGSGGWGGYRTEDVIGPAARPRPRAGVANAPVSSTHLPRGAGNPRPKAPHNAVRRLPRADDYPLPALCSTAHAKAQTRVCIEVERSRDRRFRPEW